MRLRAGSALLLSALGLLTRATSAAEAQTEAQAQAKGGSSSYARHCGNACRSAFGSVRFGDEETKPPGRFCGGGMLVESLYLCLRVHECGGDDTPLVRGLRETCVDPETGEGLMPAYGDVVDRWTEEEIGGLLRFNASGAAGGKGRVLEEVALPEEGFFEIWFRTLVSGDAGYETGWGWC